MRPAEHADLGPDDEPVEALRRYWDDLARGMPSPPDELDPTLAATVRRLRKLHAGAVPAGARDRVWARLRDEHGVHEPGGRVAPRPISPNGHASRIVRAPNVARTPPRARPLIRGHRWRPLLGPIAAVALIVALGLGGYAVWSGDGDRPTSVPAAILPTLTPTPPPAREETLLTFTLPADVLPPMDGGGSTLTQDTIPVGATWTWAAKTDPCCRALIVDHLISGAYTIRFPDDPVQLLRGGGTLRTIPAGTEIVLGPGDTLVSNTGFDHEGSNAGPAPVQLVRLDYTPGPTSTLFMPSSWIVNADDGHFFLAAVAPGPATVTLRLVDLPLDGTYQAPPGVRADLVFAVPLGMNAAGTPTVPHLADLGEGRTLNFGDGPVTLYVLTLEPLGAESAGPGAATSPT